MRHARIVLLAACLFLASCASAIEGNAVADVWSPTPENPDPSVAIQDIEIATYTGMLHVGAAQRVDYDRSPPAGGPHDMIWAECNGNVYEAPIRSENAVHSLEHGAVWVTYDPDQLDSGDLRKLERYVKAQPYLLMSPYPGLDRPISLQAWGHQLKVDDPTDVRVSQFINALRVNPYTTPEAGATCMGIPGAFNPENPPPFDPAPPGRNAVGMDGTGADVNQR